MTLQGKPMNQPLTVQELVIVVAAKNLKPSILSPDFLKYSGIIPGEWEFAKKPVVNNNEARFSFKNGVNIIAEPHRVIFAEGITKKTDDMVIIPEITRKYTQVLPGLDFQGIGINPRGFVAFAQEDAGRRFITDKLLSPGDWQDEGEVAMRASLNLMYKLQRAPLALNITEAALNQKNKSIPIVIFSGSFSYQITGNSTEEKLSCANQVVENCFTDISTFSDLINNKFLSDVTGNISLTEASVKLAESNSEESDLFAVGTGA
ncbi:hypothetical protein [Mastigocoleus testarum]|uniref:Uncharacterized protein n=1 Tax=Mastigocoleus testarum BC008 TaxID=371196 RepID=A0A0V7ZQD1_9CYAN|nr:hypothetical protein [Mastigocoleus testarum]KST66844.1 hypothetical protein BC008_27025 [Mastigocoleus testarum BC008]KST70182.1 hypothetical protein BC008_36630 [Mastigocoleus testarum BC008]